MSYKTLGLVILFFALILLPIIFTHTVPASLTTNSTATIAQLRATLLSLLQQLVVLLTQKLNILLAQRGQSGGGSGGGGGGGSGGGGDSGGGEDNTCTENWICSEWSTCSSGGFKTRTCTDENDCGTTASKPVDGQTCTPTDVVSPTVSLTAPSNNATVSGVITISATATDASGIANVVFRLDNIALATDTTPPYSTVYDTAHTTDGNHTLLAIAQDTVGHYATSTAVNITVGNVPPTPLAKMKAFYTYSSEATPTNFEMFKNLGIKTMLIKYADVNSPASFRKYLRDHSLSLDEVSLNLQNNDMNGFVFTSFSYVPTSGEFEKAVLKDGTELPIVSPFDENFWESLADYAAYIADYSESHGDILGGVLLDFELYDLGGGQYFNSDYGFEDSTFQEYFISRNIESPGDVPRAERYGWLSSHGKILGLGIGDYYAYLHERINGYAATMRQRVKAVNSSFLLGAYPSISYENGSLICTYLDDIFSGWSTVNQPAILMATDTYGYQYKIGDDHLPSYINPGNLVNNSYYDLTSAYGKPIYVYYIAGALLGYYNYLNLTQNIFDIANATNGYWIFSTASLVETCETLSHDTPPSDDWGAYRTWVNCENDTEAQYPGCCNRPSVLSSEQWTSRCCPSFDSEVQSYSAAILETNNLLDGGTSLNNTDNSTRTQLANVFDAVSAWLSQLISNFRK